jgi:predicted TIM-barrel fold metal-dependent hydrolase
MLSRRSALIGALGVGVAGAVIQSRRSFAKAAQPATPVSVDVPANACDCHTHIVGDPAKFPFVPDRVYTPEPALPEEMTALHRALHITRVVIVTPSFYGTDNSAMLYGMKARGPTARGVAVIDDKTTEQELDALHKAGVRGIRLNLATGGTTDPSIGRRQIQTAIDRVKNRGWHVQMYTGLGVITGIKDLVLASPVPIVFDHFGGTRVVLGLEQPGFADFIEIVKSGKAYVKISGAYRVSKEAPDYPDVAPFAKALIAANVDRIVWGTDWPHTNSNSGLKPTEVSPLLQIDDGRLMNQLPVWAPDAATRKKILVDNPARLYDF